MAANDAEDTVLAPGNYLLTITLSHGTIATAVDITYGPPPPDAAAGGCAASQRPSFVVACVLLALLAILTPASRPRGT